MLLYSTLFGKSFLQVVTMSNRKYIDPEDFYLMRRRAGFNVDAVAVLLDVTERTVRNWEQGMTNIPYSAYRLLKLVNGYVFTHAHWDGWFVCGDTLYSPSQRGFKPYELTYLSNYLWMARQWLNDREALRLELVDAARHVDSNLQKSISESGQPAFNRSELLITPMLTDFKGLDLSVYQSMQSTTDKHVEAKPLYL